jgi:hypothetical protein
MRIRSMTLALLFTASALAACHGASSFTPQTSDWGAASQARLAGASLPAPFDAIALRTNAAGSQCDAPNVKIPGTYLEMISSGTVKGSTYTSGKLVSVWFSSKYTVDTKPTPTPTGQPTSGPTATPRPVEIYYYTGTYTTKITKQSGCAVIIATVNGKPIISGLLGNGIGENSVQYTQPNVNSKTLATGPMSETILGLSASGGHGTATLKTSKGQLYDTATITLTKRTETKF